jgi:CubicO group peptidase (beta-lactamase class C family)
VDSLDSLVRDAVERGFSGQVLVVRDRDVLLHEGYGPADPETGIPVDTATVFAIGSVTKRFTRAAILKLEEQGRLSTSDAVGRFVDGLPPEKRDITIRQLLDMEAGLREYHDDSGDHQPMTRDEAVRRIGSQELRFEPGTDRAYSNSGYTLLAAVVEEASGRSFEAYVRDELLEPAGMENTGFHGDDRWPDERVARGYGMRTYGENAPSTWPATTWALKGAGGMVAPASDLLRFMEALRAGRVVGPAALTDLYPEDEPNLVYAGGDDFGFITFVMELDDGRHVVIVNTNSGYRVESLARALAEAVRGEPLPGRPTEERSEEGGAPSAGEGLPDSPRGRAAGWILAALEDGSPEALQELVETRFTAAMRNAFPMEEHLRVLGQLSDRVREVGVRGVMPVAEYTLAIVLEDGGRVVADITPEPPHLIEGMGVGGG